MTKITILGVGKLKEKFLSDAVREYDKRLKRFAIVNIIELKDEPHKDQLSKKELESIKEIEGKKILEKIPSNSFVIALDILGVSFSSETFAQKILELQTYVSSHLTFIIGGSNGISDEVLKKADLRISFSKMTFPHQLMRVILYEQLYRAFSILNNGKYHK
jgi:23S rRNA (pseudouridine1915-N3)-methyltransferase